MVHCTVYKCTCIQGSVNYEPITNRDLSFIYGKFHLENDLLSFIIHLSFSPYIISSTKSVELNRYYWF